MNLPIVLGVGNPLLGDDGIGPVAVARLKNAALPAGVDLVDAGTSALTVFDVVTGGRDVILIDAVHIPGGAPGTIVELDLTPAAVRQRAPRFSLHEVDLQAVFALARALSRTVAPVHVIGFIPDAPLLADCRLSPPAAAAVDEIVARVRRRLAGLSASGDREHPEDAAEQAASMSPAGK
jgi:hydrogenase maturation protease